MTAQTLVPTCHGCGGAPCEDLFHHLLALDFAQPHPFGLLHGVHVAAYHLQHPDRLADDRREFPWTMLRVYADHGLPAVSRLAGELRRLNRDLSGPLRVPHRFRTHDVPRGPAPTSWAVTLHDVAVDGTFPVDGHPLRVRRWVTATLDAWYAVEPLAAG